MKFSAVACFSATDPGGWVSTDRTLRALRSAGFSAQAWDGVGGIPGKGDGAILLARAGVWFSRQGAIEPPQSPEAGVPLAAVGLPTHDQRVQVGVSEEEEKWRRRWSLCGGDFHGPERPVTNGVTHLPMPPVLWLNAAAARLFSREAESALDLDATWRRVQLKLRIVHWAPFDVFTDSRMRVVQLITSLQCGGAERVAMELTRELREQGVPTLLIGLGRPTRRAWPAPSGWVDLAGHRRDTQLDAVRGWAVAFGADLIHAHLVSDDFCEELERVVDPRWPMVQTIHNTREAWPAGLAERLGLNPVWRCLYVACSQAVDEDLRRATAEPRAVIRTVWNGIRPEDWVLPRGEREVWRREIRTRLGLGEDDLVLLSLANPRPQKRLERLPAIVAELNLRVSTGRSVHLLLVGEASAGSRLAQDCVAAVKSEAERLNVVAQLHWCGSAMEVRPFLAAADVLICVSDHEGLSLAQLEAIAAGLPVVATAVGGAPEVAGRTRDCSLLPVSASAAEFAVAIQKLDPKGAHGECPPRDGLPPDFTLPVMVRRQAWLYERWSRRCAAPRRKPSGLVLWTNNFSTGGAQSSARRLLLELHRRGHRVRVVTLQEWPEQPTPGTQQLRAAGLEVLSLPPPQAIEPQSAVARALDWMELDPPQAIVCWNALAEYKLRLTDACWDTPIFDVSPGEMFFDSLSKLFARPPLGLPISNPAEYGRRLAGIIVKYEAERGQAERLGSPVSVIRNGVSLIPSPGSGSALADSKSGRIVLGTAARLNPHKRLDLLLAAFRLAASRIPNAELWIAGDTEPGTENHRAELESLALGLPVRFLGEVSDIPAFLAKLDGFVAISEPAGCPNATLEAMAAGVPVVATDHGGASEQVKDRVTGRLVGRTDIPSLAEAMVELATHPDWRREWGAGGRARIEQCFSLQRMADGYERVLGLVTPTPAPVAIEPAETTAS